jgi:hypothetical protein
MQVGYGQIVLILERNSSQTVWSCEDLVELKQTSRKTWVIKTNSQLSHRNPIPRIYLVCNQWTFQLTNERILLGTLYGRC